MLDRAPPSLTEVCRQFAVSENLLRIVDLTTARNRGVDHRGTVLSFVIMSAAGHFFDGLKWDESPTRQRSDSYLRGTNSDVITAEAMVWIAFLMNKLWKAEKRIDYKMFERIGYVTVNLARRLSLGIIEDETGVDFADQAMDRRKLYLRAEKKNSARPMCEAFASVILSSVGRRSLADPLCGIGAQRPAE